MHRRRRRRWRLSSNQRRRIRRIRASIEKMPGPKARRSGLRSRSKMRVVARSYQRSSFPVIVFLLIGLDCREQARGAPVAEPGEELGLLGETPEARMERFDRASDRLPRSETFEKRI